MKIAILSCFYPYRGGISQFNANIFDELRRSHDVRAFNFKRQYPDILFPGKTQYVSAEDNSAVPVESTALLDTANPFSYCSTARTIRQWNPDVLIMRYWMSWFAPSLGYVARHMAPACKRIGILDNVVPHERHFFDTPFTKYFLSGLDGCVTLCDEVGEDLKRLAPGKRHTVLPHPLYTHFGAKVPRSEALGHLGIPDDGSRILLFFGLIRKYKGLDILLKAFRSLPDNYRLIVAGEPYGSFEEYQDIIDSYPPETVSRTHLFLSFIPDSEVKFFFSAGDLVVLPYRSATQSGVGAIATHFQVPLIVTDTGGLREAVEGRGTGLVTESADEDGILARIGQYFASPDLQDSLQQSMLAEKDRLSWERFCSDLTDFATQL